MRRPALLSICLCLAALVPGVVQAQSLTGDARDQAARHGWGSFLSQTGAALGATGTMAVFASADWSPNDDEIAALLLIPLGAGLGAPLGYLAEEGGWNPHVGWALAGLYPGALLGASLGMASALAGGAAGQRETLLEATLASAAAGAALGALGLWAESYGGGHPGALLGGFYGGFGTGLAVGLVAASFSDDAEAAVAPLIASAVGGVLGIVVTEAIRQTTE